MDESPVLDIFNDDCCVNVFANKIILMVPRQDEIDIYLNACSNKCHFSYRPGYEDKITKLTEQVVNYWKSNDISYSFLFDRYYIRWDLFVRDIAVLEWNRFGISVLFSAAQSSTLLKLLSHSEIASMREKILDHWKQMDILFLKLNDSYLQLNQLMSVQKSPKKLIFSFCNLNYTVINDQVKLDEYYQKYRSLLGYNTQ